MPQVGGHTPGSGGLASKEHQRVLAVAVAITLSSANGNRSAETERMRVGSSPEARVRPERWAETRSARKILTCADAWVEVNTTCIQRKRTESCYEGAIHSRPTV